MTVFGRLEPGVALVEARADFSTLASRFAQEFPETQARYYPLGWRPR